MNPVTWRWEEKDFGFRFRTGRGKNAAEHYQARGSGEFYVVPSSQRKLEQENYDRLVASAVVPGAPRVVPNPWHNYEREWDWIQTDDGLPLNYAGCLDREEIHRREDEGVARALELVAALIERPQPAPMTLALLRQIHRELMGEIYPFAGEWRTVALHKGGGPTKWPLPPGGIEPLMDVFERDVLLRSPVLSENNDEVYAYVSEVICELLAIHPFREGNGRTAFIVANLLLMQSDLAPLNVWDRKRDESRYFAACEAGRIKRDYGPLAVLVAEWEVEALARWRQSHGQG
jgi:cell filamentation protein